MISLGNVLKKRDKQTQAETILSKAGKMIERELASNPANTEQWKELRLSSKLTWLHSAFKSLN